MPSSSIALLPTLCFVLLLARPQKPPPPPPIQEPPEIRVTPSPGAKKEISRTTKTMQGFWVLKEFDWPHLHGVDSEFRGYCLVGGNHISFEVHIGLKGPDQKLNDVMFDSGIWRFEVGQANRLVMNSRIGSFLDKDNRVAFRPEDTQCRYEVLAVGDQMVWRKADGQRLVFERLLDGGPAREDVFGRKLPEPKDDEGEPAPGPKGEPAPKSEPPKEPPH